MEPLVPAAQPRGATPQEMLAFLVAYATLLARALEAREQQLPPRDAPVTREALHNQNVGDDVLAWMLYQAHIEHLCADAGAFAARDSLLFGEQSAFALTERGEHFATAFFLLAVSDLD